MAARRCTGPRRFVEGEQALSEEARPGAGRKLTGKEEALLVATACSSPPAGRARWTLELLADEMVKLTVHESLSRETVRRRLAENGTRSGRWSASTEPGSAHRRGATTDPARARGECQELCVRDFCEGGFWFAYIEHKASEARLSTLLGRSERSSP
jgi:hypothetical protein